MYVWQNFYESGDILYYFQIYTVHDSVHYNKMAENVNDCQFQSLLESSRLLGDCPQRCIMENKFIPTAGQGLSSMRKGYLFIFAGAFCISFAAFFVKGASNDSSAVAFYRLFFGSIALFLLATIQKARLTPSRPLFFLVVMAGLLFAGDLVLWHKSILIIGPGIATIVANFEVILLAIYGVVFLREKMSVPQKISIPLALIGLAMLLGLHESVIPDGIIYGTSIALISAVFYAAYILTLRRSQMVAEKISPIASIAWVSAVACVVVGIFCFVSGVSLRIPDTKTLGILAALGIFCQSLGWVLLSRGLPLLPPFRAGLIMLTQPALAFVWDILFAGAAVGVINIIGAVLAITAIGMGIYNKSTK